MFMKTRPIKPKRTKLEIKQKLEQPESKEMQGK